MPAEPSLLRRSLPVAALLLALGTGGACSGSPDSTSQARSTPTTAATDLSDVCPDTVIVQTAWFPQAEAGALYNLLGSDYTVDAYHQRVQGSLVTDGKDTGVDVQVRAGGPAIDFHDAATEMYDDPRITLGQVSTDDAIRLAGEAPTTAVVAPLDIAPYMIMWDAHAHPEFRTISDIGQTDTKVLYAQGATYMEYLVGSGILKASQVDGSYRGSPDQFLAAHGDTAEQGFATYEPYELRHLAGFGHDVGYQLVQDTGYPTYPEALAVRTGDMHRLAPCLRKLVPIVQRSAVAYATDPGHTDDLIVKIDKRYGKTPYTRGAAAYSAKKQRQLGIVGNGPNTTLGDFDMTRVRRVLSLVRQIFAGQHKPLAKDLAAHEIATNRFVDPSVGLGR